MSIVLLIVNHTAENPRIGVLLCINGTGILNAWMKRNSASAALSYSEINGIAEQAPIGSDGVSILPFGNGSERLLENRSSSCNIFGLQFNRHSQPHLLRAAQEGIVFAFAYGGMMNAMGIYTKMIRQARPIFPQFVSVYYWPFDRYMNYTNDGSIGSARGAGMELYHKNRRNLASLRKWEN